ncbi:hypothetical protein RFE08_003956, partial [Klebsiella aerogenes]
LACSPDKAPAAIRVHLPGGVALTGATKRSWPVARIRRLPLSGYISPVALRLPGLQSGAGRQPGLGVSRYPGTSPRWRCAYRGYKAELAGSPDKAPAAIRGYRE